MDSPLIGKTVYVAFKDIMRYQMESTGQTVEVFGATGVLRFVGETVGLSNPPDPLFPDSEPNLEIVSEVPFHNVAVILVKS